MPPGAARGRFPAKGVSGVRAGGPRDMTVPDSVRDGRSGLRLAPPRPTPPDTLPPGARLAAGAPSCALPGGRNDPVLHWRPPRPRPLPLAAPAPAWGAAAVPLPATATGAGACVYVGLRQAAERGYVVLISVRICLAAAATVAQRAYA